MVSTTQKQLATLLALGALLAGCAHATPSVASDGAIAAATPSTRDGAGAGDEVAAAGNGKEPACVVVTGSRLPSCGPPGSQGLRTDQPLRVYSYDELRSTGRDGNLGAALQALEPSITHR